MRGQYLFSEWDMFTVVEHQKTVAIKKVEQVSAAQLQATSENELVAELVKQLHLNVPVLKEPYIAESGEAKVDVSRDPRRAIFNRSRPFYIQGIQTIIAVPFEGDRDLFKVQPNTFSSIKPMAELAGMEVRLTYEQFEPNSEVIKAAYTKTLQEIEQYLGWQRPSADDFNNQLEGLLRKRLSERKQKLEAGAAMIGSLGLPTVKPE
jgi:hypothetical protein